MDPALFIADIEARPDRLREAAAVWAGGNPWAGLHARRLVFLGMGSSYFAASVAADRLQNRGVAATAVLASSDLLPVVDADDHVIAISASGSSVETLVAVEHLHGRCPITVMTNVGTGTLLDLADTVVPMHAGAEAGGVSCRSFTHTQALFLLLEDQLVGGIDPSVFGRAADAAANLLDTRDSWLAPVSELLLGPEGTSVVAPVSRLSNARQSALMFREGPRRPAIACETGDWSHIDVYLTKTTDYRMLLLAGSRWEAQLMDWCTQRGSTVVAAGADVPGANFTLRYRNDSDALVRLLAESTTAESVAAGCWRGIAGV
jgi:glucosamine--fructose-6-phosphate aminotransferase (isomerizing)